MKKFDTFSDKVLVFFNTIFMLILIVIMLYPFVELTVLSLSTREDALRSGLKLFTKNPTFQAYKQILSSPEIVKSFFNSINRVVFGTLLSLFLTALTAYPLSKKDMPFNKFFTFLFIFAMMFTGGLIPTYLLIKGLGLIDTRWALILPAAMVPYNLIIMRNFLRGIPSALEESARIDGASNFIIWYKIIMPLSKPVLATIALWIAVAQWNAYFDALIYITDRSKFVLQVILRRILLENQADIYTKAVGSIEQMSDLSTEETVKAALVMVSTIPIMVVYPFLQKYFTKGILLGAVKG